MSSHGCVQQCSTRCQGPMLQAPRWRISCETYEACHTRRQGPTLQANSFVRYLTTSLHKCILEQISQISPLTPLSASGV